MNSTITWQLLLYPISWINSSLFLYLFFCLIFMRLKIDLVNGLCALYFLCASVFSLLQVLSDQTNGSWETVHLCYYCLCCMLDFSIMKYLFQQHFLFQIRIVGDIFISGDYIEEDVTDIQSYLNQTCKKWVNTTMTDLNWSPPLGHIETIQHVDIGRLEASTSSLASPAYTAWCLPGLSTSGMPKACFSRVSECSISWSLSS